MGPGGNAHKSSLLQQDIHAGFPKAIDAILRDNEELAERVARSLVDAHFPSTLHEEILRALGIGSRFVQSRRMYRDSRFSGCGTEGLRLSMRGVRIRGSPERGTGCARCSTYKVAWSARGPITSENGLALCALHHRLFDKGRVYPVPAQKRSGGEVREWHGASTNRSGVSIRGRSLFLKRMLTRPTPGSRSGTHARYSAPLSDPWRCREVGLNNSKSLHCVSDGVDAPPSQGRHDAPCRRSSATSVSTIPKS